MSTLRIALALGAVLSLAAVTAPQVEAQKAGGTCVNKAGEGTNNTEDGAKFQAYEAILQGTDWGMWSSWMATSQKVGVAPGYAVSNLKSKCTKGTGLGFTCIVQAGFASRLGSLPYGETELAR